MSIKCIIKRSEYHDSVTLMQVARELTRLPGVADAAVMMATEANKGLLRNSGMLTLEAEAASPNDLVIAVKAGEEAAGRALGEVEKLLRKKPSGEAGGEYQPRTIRAAVRTQPSANVAVISVAGRYAAAEAWEALRNGLHVLLFSDNVSLEDEIALKRYAIDHGLLLMGPGAGTAILNGVALGFANVLPRGPVGIISAAGTGLQEVSTLLARQGIGITQGIGTGGRDLKEAVGGLMMLAGLEALQADPDTQVITLISKPPAAFVAEKVLAQAVRSDKPTIVCFLGAQADLEAPGKVRLARTLEETAWLAATAAGSAGDASAELAAEKTMDTQSLPTGGKHGCLRALFSGGTLCYEAQVIWRDLLPEPVYSNAPLDPANQLPDPHRSQGHSAVDLGEEEFTVGRPHPMIDNDLRIRRLLQEARDPETAVILLDVVLGYGAHPNPAAELGPAIREVHHVASQAGRAVRMVASVTGTEEDPQVRSNQVRALEEAGVEICPSNAAAARLAARLLLGA